MFVAALIPVTFDRPCVWIRTLRHTKSDLNTCTDSLIWFERQIWFRMQSEQSHGYSFPPSSRGTCDERRSTTSSHSGASARAAIAQSGTLGCVLRSLCFMEEEILCWFKARGHVFKRWPHPHTTLSLQERPERERERLHLTGREGVKASLSTLTISCFTWEKTPLSNLHKTSNPGLHPEWIPIMPTYPLNCYTRWGHSQISVWVRLCFYVPSKIMTLPNSGNIIWSNLGNG